MTRARKKKFPPNPLPCGCGVKGEARLNLEGTGMEYRGLHMVHCPMHAASPDLLHELAQLVRLLEPLEEAGSLNVPGLATLNGARAALEKATRKGE
jgi:hypothetical protein